MKLRRLEIKDAKYMLEWMHDDSVNKYFRFNAKKNTIDTVIEFISASIEDIQNYHFAVVDDNDEYMGTVSLKNIDNDAMNAEYAIVLRACAQGKGLGKYATESILKFAFVNLKLNRVYLNVLSDNVNAIRMYEKTGFIYEGEFKNHIMINKKLKSLKWYRMMRNEYENGQA